jgi:putative oxidoreductase
MYAAPWRKSWILVGICVVLWFWAEDAHRRAPMEVFMYADNLNRYSPYALAVLRIIAALLFIEHGTQKLFNFPPLPSGGLPPPFSLFWIGAIMEFVGGLLILIGLFTRPVAFILAGEMAVAYWMVHAPMNPFPAVNGGDAAILFCFIFLLFVFSGSGAWSVDGKTRR